MESKLFFEESQWRTGERVELSRDGARIIWRRPFDIVQSWDLDERDAFNDFVALDGEPLETDKLLRFARRYGPLLLCEHGLPRTHLKVRSAETSSESLLLSHGVQQAFRRVQIIEEVAAWRPYVRQATTVLQIAGLLHKGTTAPTELWAPLRPLLPAVTDSSGQPIMETDQPLDVQRRALALAVQTWLDWGDVGVTYTLAATAKASSTAGRVRVGANTLFGSLALSLALAVARAPGMVQCAGCGEDFSPVRPRDPARLAWCGKEECHNRKKMYEARRRRARRREEGRS